jgi:hypothetical protein
MRRTGKRRHPPLALTPRIGSIQIVRHRHWGRVVRVEVHRVLEEVVDGPNPVH